MRSISLPSMTSTARIDKSKPGFLAKKARRSRSVLPYVCHKSMQFSRATFSKLDILHTTVRCAHVASGSSCYVDSMYYRELWYKASTLLSCKNFSKQPGVVFGFLRCNCFEPQSVIGRGCRDKDAHSSSFALSLRGLAALGAIHLRV